MNMPSLRAQHWLIFAAIGVLFFACGTWLVRLAQPAEPLPGLREWQAEVFTPLADERLTLARLTAAVAGQLWLQPRLDGARLLYRAEWQTGDQPWALEAELALTQAERASLLSAFGASVQAGEQSLGEQLLAQLGSHQIASLSLTPLHDVAAERLISSLGAPRLRLALGGGQAWVYPDLGLTAHTDGERLRLLHAVPREAQQR